MDPSANLLDSRTAVLLAGGHRRALTQIPRPFGAVIAVPLHDGVLGLLWGDAENDPDQAESLPWYRPSALRFEGPGPDGGVVRTTLFEGFIIDVGVNATVRLHPGAGVILLAQAFSPELPTFGGWVWGTQARELAPVPLPDHLDGVPNLAFDLAPDGGRIGVAASVVATTEGDERVTRIQPLRWSAAGLLVDGNGPSVDLPRTRGVLSNFRAHVDGEGTLHVLWKLAGAALRHLTLVPGEEAWQEVHPPAVDALFAGWVSGVDEAGTLTVVMNYFRIDRGTQPSATLVRWNGGWSEPVDLHPGHAVYYPFDGYDDEGRWLIGWNAFPNETFWADEPGILQAEVWALRP